MPRKEQITQEFTDRVHKRVTAFLQEHEAELPKRLRADLAQTAINYQHELLQRVITTALMLAEKDTWDEKPPNRYTTLMKALIAYFDAYPFKEDEPRRDLDTLLNVSFIAWSDYLKERWQYEKSSGTPLPGEPDDPYFD